MNTIQIIVDEAESTLMIVCNNRDILKYAQAFIISRLLNKDVIGKDIKDIEYLLAKLKDISSICFDRFIVKTDSLRKTSDLIEALQHNIYISNLPIIININWHNSFYSLAEAVKLIQEGEAQRCLRDISQKQNNI